MPSWNPLPFETNNFETQRDYNSNGPYYQNNAAYFFGNYPIASVPNGHLQGVTKTQTTETWDKLTGVEYIVNEANIPESYDNYNPDSTHHYVYCGTVTSPVLGTEIDINLRKYTLQNGAVTEQWTDLGKITTIPPYDFNNQNTVLGTSVFNVRVDKSNGNVYIFYCGAPISQPGYLQGTLGYIVSVDQGVTWSAYTQIDVAPLGEGAISLINSFINNGILYCIYALTPSNSTGAISTFNLWSSASGVIANLTPYVWDGPNGCAPFADPAYVVFDAIAYNPFPVVNFVLGVTSKPILYNGSYYFTSTSISRSILIHQITSVGVYSVIDTGILHYINVGATSSSTATYGANHQLFNYNGALALMYNGGTIPCQNINVDICSASYIFNNTGICQPISTYYWTLLNSTTKLPVGGTVNLALDNSPDAAGIMPLQVLANGTTTRIGQISLVAVNTGNAAFNYLFAPLGLPLPSPSMPCPCLINCPGGRALQIFSGMCSCSCPCAS